MTTARLVLCLVLAGCIDRSEPARVLHGDTGWVQYKPNARFVEEEPGYRSVTVEDRDGLEVLTFQFASRPTIELAAGDVVIGTATPYFRKVVSATRRGSTLEVVTEPAALRDAIEEADISAFVPFADPGELAPTLAEPVNPDSPPMRPRPDAPADESYGTAVSKLSDDFYAQRTITPFALANRNLLALPFISLPLSIKTTSDSYLKLRGGYTIRIVISGDDVYFRTEGRGGYDLNLGVTLKGNLSAQGVSVGLDTGKIGSFSVLGISGSLTFDVDATAAGPIDVPSLTVGKRVDRDATAWVRYDSDASTKWATGGSLVTNTIASYRDVAVSNTGTGHIRFGVRSKVGISLSATLDTPGVGTGLTSSVSTTLTPQLDIDVVPGNPAKWDLDACMRATASVSNKVDTFLNPIPGVSFDDVSIVDTELAKTWTLYSDCWDVAHN